MLAIKIPLEKEPNHVFGKLEGEALALALKIDALERAMVEAANKLQDETMRLRQPMQEQLEALLPVLKGRQWAVNVEKREYEICMCDKHEPVRAPQPDWMKDLLDADDAASGL